MLDSLSSMSTSSIVTPLPRLAGMLSTMQNIGSAVGVAVTGVVFFAALHGGYAHALELALVQLALLLVAVAVPTRLLPRLT